MKVVTKPQFKVYFDMDGVLDDFDEGVRRMLGFEPLPQGIEDNRYKKALFNSIAHTPHFYFKLHPFYDSIFLFYDVEDSIGAENVEILTGVPLPHKGCDYAADKEKWVRQFINSHTKVNCVFSKDKPKFVEGPQSILIDDYSKNIKQWKEAGGTGILFKTVNQTREELLKLGVLR